MTDFWLSVFADMDPDLPDLAAIDAHQQDCSTCALDGGLSLARQLADDAAAALSTGAAS